MTISLMQRCDGYFCCAMTGQPIEIRNENLQFGHLLEQACSEQGLTMYIPEIAEKWYKPHNQRGYGNDSPMRTHQKSLLSTVTFAVMRVDVASIGVGWELAWLEHYNVPVILVSRYTLEDERLSCTLRDSPQIWQHVLYSANDQALEETMGHIESLLTSQAAVQSASKRVRVSIQHETDPATGEIFLVPKYS